MSQTEHINAARIDALPVASIKPVQGWQLCELIEDDDDGFSRPSYVARSAERDVFLNVSRFHFSPSQARFAWLVEHGFPCASGCGPWTDIELDGQLARKVAA